MLVEIITYTIICVNISECVFLYYLIVQRILESEKFSQANLVEQQPDHVHLCDE